MTAVLAAALILAAAICVYSIYISYNALTVHNYAYASDKLTEEIRLVILADLHSHEFGEENADLISAVQKQEPDAILMVGDFLNREDTDHTKVVKLTEALTAIAPVYYSIGNHEQAYMDQWGNQLLSDIAETGAVIAELTYTDVELNGQTVRIGGMLDYAFALDGRDSTNPETMEPEIYNYLRAFQDTDSLKIMLAHQPESFVLGEASVTWDIDLVVSGHAHGGQVVLPLLGGLYAPEQGLFPEYVHGLYEKDKLDLLITSGLGSGTALLPRFNNPPEIAVLTLSPKE